MTEFLHQLRLALQTYQPRPYRQGPPEAAVLIPLIQRGDSFDVVLTLRASHLDKHASQVAFPGGKADATDATLMDTALRESQEEIDLPPERVEIIGELSKVISRHGLLVTPYVGVVETPIRFTPNPAEIDEIFSVPIDFFLQATPHRHDRLHYEGRHYSIPAWKFEQFDIWGLSAIILVDFLNHCFDANIEVN